MELLGLALFCAAYFMPAIVAACRSHASAWGIFALNLFLGWTAIGWLVALIWALANKGQSIRQMVVFNNRNNEGQQPSQPIYIPVPQPASPQPLMSATAAAPQIGSDTRACPTCAETIKAAAKKCRFCGENLSPMLITQHPEV